MRGVHGFPRRKDAEAAGSSPHARGPLDAGSRVFVYIRIIPACAGSTNFGHGRILVVEDHPRMRGVHAVALSAAAFALGSSPHARGPPQDAITL